MSDDFGQWPPTLGEARAAKSESPGDWSPRDALVSILRRIDNGELEVRHLIVVFSEMKDDTLADNWTQAGKANLHEQLGLMQAVSYGLFEAGLK